MILLKNYILRVITTLAQCRCRIACPQTYNNNRRVPTEYNDDCKNYLFCFCFIVS